MKAPDDILHRLLLILHRGVSDIGYLAKDGKKEQAFDLADALENVPGFLANWEPQHFEQIKRQLEKYQSKYKEVSWYPYTKYLEAEAPPEHF